MTQATATTELSAFRQDAVEHLDRLQRSGGVEFLTIDGETKGVVMAPHVYDEMVGTAEQAEITKELRLGFADIDAGRVISAQDLYEKIAAEHGFTLDDLPSE